MSVHRLPSRPFSDSDKAELARAIAAKPLTYDDLVNGPLETIGEFGPTALANDELVDVLQRIAVIASALVGFSRVPVEDGLRAIANLLDRVYR